MLGWFKQSGTIREDGNGEFYTWSVKRFKKWKKQFKQEYFNQYGKKFEEDVPSKAQREDIYKSVLGLKKIDVFGTGRGSRAGGIDEIILEKAKSVSALIVSSD